MVEALYDYSDRITVDPMIVEKCPIQVTFNNTSIGKKWTLTIIRDLIFGMNKFMDFLRTNPGLSAKVLSERLKAMEKEDLVKKVVVNSTPVSITYHLTEKGAALNKILYELSMFGAIYYPEQVFRQPLEFEHDADFNTAVEVFGQNFRLENHDIDYYRRPEIEINKI